MANLHAVIDSALEEDESALTLPRPKADDRVVKPADASSADDSASNSGRTPAGNLGSGTRKVSQPVLSTHNSFPPLALGPDQMRLGPYQVVCELASGGMATVYLALYRSVEGFEKLCAVKRIHPHLAGDRAFANMFVDEAQIAARISHPYVCSVFSFGKTQKSHYIAMEFLRGEPLSAISKKLARNPELGDEPGFPALAARVVANLAEGLHAAHTLRDSRGVCLDVVHRDVTPQNLFVLYDGSVRVTDFGIAHARRRLHQTEGQKLKGKLSYIAPEQLNDGAVDLRVDVWGLGVTLWELLAGRRLFLGANEGETLAAVMSRVVQAPSAFRSSVPAELDRIVLRALERDLGKRYRTARDFSRDLERFLASSGDAVPAMDVADWMARVFPQGAERIQNFVELAARVSAATADDTVMRVPSSPPSRGPVASTPASSWSLPAPPSVPTRPDRVHVEARPSMPTRIDGSAPKSVASQVAASLRPAPIAIKLSRDEPAHGRNETTPTAGPTPTSNGNSNGLNEDAELSDAITSLRSFAPDEVSKAFDLVRPRRQRSLGPLLTISLVGAAALLTASFFVVRRPLPPTPEHAPQASRQVAAKGGDPARTAANIAAATQERPVEKVDPMPPLAPAPVRTPAPSHHASAKAVAAVAPAAAAADSAAIAQGDVFVTTPGGTAEILENGRSLGRAPGVFRLPVGQHQLVIKSTSGELHATVNVAPHTTTLVTVPLKP